MQYFCFTGWKNGAPTVSEVTKADFDRRKRELVRTGGEMAFAVQMVGRCEILMTQYEARAGAAIAVQSLKFE